MLDEPELHALALDIKERGLDHPILLDPDGTLLDGRNRLAACERVGVEPAFTTYHGADPRAMITTLNARRRYVSQGQLAMIAARYRASQPGTPLPLAQDAERHGLSTTRLSNAVTVLINAPDLAELVWNGGSTLDAAYATVAKSKAAAKALSAAHTKLKAEAPDLAAQVTDGELTIEQAQQRQRIAAFDTRHRLDQADGPTFTEQAIIGTVTWDQAESLAHRWAADREQAITATRHALHTITAHWHAVRRIARTPQLPFTQEVLDGLTPDDRTLAQRLAAGETPDPTAPTRT
jgi:hypothetical protein